MASQPRTILAALGQQGPLSNCRASDEEHHAVAADFDARQTHFGRRESSWLPPMPGHRRCPPPLDRRFLSLKSLLNVAEKGRITTPLGKVSRQGLDLPHHPLDDESPRWSKVLRPTKLFVSSP